MLHRNKKPQDLHEGKWNGLGGKVEPGESPEECAVREIREESGLEVDQLACKGFIAFPSFDGANDWHVHVYLATVFPGECKPCGEGELDWIENEKVLSLNLWEGDRIFLPWLDRPDFFSAKLIYQSGKLASHQVTFYPARPLAASR